MRWFIVNPVAGNGRGQKVWRQLKKIMDERQIPYRVLFSEQAGHAEELARRAVLRSDVKSVIAVGGDGTVHEVGNGLVGSIMPMGFIPAGSGNDFALAHRIPANPGQALERILQHQVRRVDTADIDGKTMIGFAGIGFDGRVAEAVNLSSFKRWLGKLNYIWGALRVLRSFEPAQVSVSIDGKKIDVGGVWLIAVANNPYYGGGMKICPFAVNDDGKLDICCVNNLSRHQFLKIFPTVYKGVHIHHPSVTMRQGKEIIIDSDTRMVIHADGEVIGETPLTVTVRPRSLSIL
ncbi:diacylglycerol kinase [Marinithermofilum abyssi]|uniref:Diacylglycerol kinase n=1 Tax=Marinithermofilum abyssi TaxID=1571185 RepID=A0A8J2YDR2_9BACL|nr:diacylglycerol kinase family protein [Marinithermofilum abyssi]GGE19374.1 diacylglycerol kinase [Marinithermofilum abyssi]